MYKKVRKSLNLLLVLLCTGSCTRETREVEEIPLAPLEWIVDQGEVIIIRAPLHVHDQQYHTAGYTADGKRTSKVLDEVLFPTDVIIVFRQEINAPTVFLARSPHGGCLMRWNTEKGELEDPCFGSRFDIEGKYRVGPSPRDLDRLRSTIRGNMLWVKGEIVYGEKHP